MPRLGRSLLAAACLLLGIASIAQYLQDLRLRAPAERFGREFLIDLRWPWAASMRLEPAGDLESDVVVQSALQEAPGSLRLEELSPSLRQAWIKSMSRRDEELRSARDLMLDAIAVRPGWAYHRLLLGQAVNSAAKRPGNGDLAGKPELWAKPMRQAARAAPGLDAIWVALGEGYLENWPGLPPTMRAEVPAVLRRAFLDKDFVSRHLLSATAALGRTEAMSLLPENAHLLDAAAQALSREGDIQGAALLMARMDKAEKEERAQDLRSIEKRYRLGDVDGLRTACLAWTSEHPVGDFDDRVARAQAARVLELWPSDRTGSWRSDARADLVRFFLNGRESDVKGETLARSLDPLSGVPEAVLARVKLLMGDLEDAEELASRSGDVDALEWTPYFVELARFELKRGRSKEARSALERVAPGAEEECDVLQTRRDVARAMGDGAELEAVNQRLESLKMGSQSADVVPEFPEVSLSFCIDPAWAKGQVLMVEIEVAAPAVLFYGWDGGRSGTLSASGSSSILRVPLVGLAGRRTFSVRASAGGPVGQLHATLAEPAK
jgi:hypothetical protein